MPHGSISIIDGWPSYASGIHMFTAVKMHQEEPLRILKKTAIHLSWMDPEDFVVTLSFEHINNTYRNKCAQVHRNKSKAAPEYHAAC